MVELACRYCRYGYRMVKAPLQAEKFAVNRKRLERLFRLEGLKVPAKQPEHGRLWLKAIGRTYFTWRSATSGLMVISYFGRAVDRCSRASYGLISFAVNRTPSGYPPSMHLTLGWCPFHVIRRAHCSTTSRLFSSTPFHFFSSDDQQRS